MPDTSMCSGKGCDKKDSCYRYRAKPCDYQRYFLNPPIRGGECEKYWPIENRKDLRDE
jgi:hypothetical protein